MVRGGSQSAAAVLPRLLPLLVVAAIPGLAAGQEAPSSPLRHGSLTARVLDLEGRPLAGAEVVLVPQSPELLLGAGELETPRWFVGPAMDLVRRATADQDGRIELAASPPSGDARLDAVYAGVEWVVFILAPGHRPLVRGHAFSDGSALDLGDVRLETGGGACGRVVDDHGEPLEDAVVELMAEGPRPTVDYRARAAQRQAFRSRTDAHGRYEFPCVMDGPLRITVRHPEAAAEASLSTSAPWERQVLELGDIRLPRGGRICGRILDSQGTPVAGAQVFVGDGTLAFDRTQLADLAAVARSMLVGRPAFESNAEGRFVATGVRGPSAHLLVLAPRCDAALQRCVPAGCDDLEIVMKPEGRLLLQVRDSSTSEVITGAEVIAFRAQGPVQSGRPLALPVERLGEGDETIYAIGQVGPALTSVQVTAPGHAPAWIEPDGVEAGRHRLVSLELRPAAVLEVRVEDQAGEPLSGASITLLDMQAMLRSDRLASYSLSASVPVRLHGRAFARTDAQGHFRFSELTPGAWMIEAERSGFARQKDTVTSLSYGATRSTRLQLKPADAAQDEAAEPAHRFAVRGRVLADGAPVAGAAVWLQRAGSPSLLRRPGASPGDNGDFYRREDDEVVSTTADGSGRYQLVVEAAGDWSLCAASPWGGVLLEPRPLTLGGPDAVPEQNIALGTHGLGVAVVAEPDGSPLVDAWVWIEPGAIPALARNCWRTDSAGRVELHDLLPGRYTVTASRPHCARTRDEPDRNAPKSSVTVSIPEDARAPVRIALAPGVILEGVVRDEHGVVVPDGTSVWATRKEPVAASAWTKTVHGRFHLLGLDPGRWELQIPESGDPYTSDAILGRTSVEIVGDEEATCSLEVRYRGSKPYRRQLTTEEYYRPTAFDSAQWKDPELVEQGVRIRMIDDLQDKHELVGLSRAEIDALLGPPDREEDGKLTWHLGRERSLFAMDSEHLTISLGGDGASTSFEVWTD